MANSVTVNQKFNGDFNITIYHRITNGYEKITPIVEDGVKWETERQGAPGKLTFKVYQNKNNELNFQEGDEVRLNFKLDGGDWVVLFYGYIFTKKRNKNGWIDVTAYDLLRYFKNKATYVYTNKTAGDVVKFIANDYKLTTGAVESTKYVIGERVEDDQSLFDIIQNALDLTLMSTNELYVLYADRSGVCLRNAKNMRTNVVINNAVAEDFDYTSTIDDETYNEVELYYDNDETNKREYYNAIDTKNVGNWGRLRLTESIQNPTNAKERVKQMLKLYNRKTRKLTVKNAFGDCQCRAGASVIAQFDLGDVTVSNYMLIEKATHVFKKDEYRMDLTLDGFNEEISEDSVLYSETNVVKKTETTTEGTKDQLTPNTVADSKESYLVTIKINDVQKAQAIAIKYHKPLEYTKTTQTNSDGSVDKIYADESGMWDSYDVEIHQVKDPIKKKYIDDAYTIKVKSGTIVNVWINPEINCEVKYPGDNNDWCWSPDVSNGRKDAIYFKTKEGLNKDLNLYIRLDKK